MGLMDQPGLFNLQTYYEGTRFGLPIEGSYSILNIILTFGASIIASISVRLPSKTVFEAKFELGSAALHLLKKPTGKET